MFDHETCLAAIEEYEKIQADKANKSEVLKKETNVITVLSYNIAKELVVDYGFFSSLIRVGKDKYDPEGKRHIWIFKRYPEITQVFNNLCNAAREAKEK